MLFIQWLFFLTGFRIRSILLSGILVSCTISSVVQAQPVSQPFIKDSLVASLQRQLQQATQDTTRIVIIGEIATQYHKLGESEQAHIQLQKGLKLAKKTNNSLNLGRIYFQLGVYYDRQSMFTPSIAAYRKAILLLQQAHRVSEATTVMYSLARLYTAHGYTLLAINQIVINLAYADQTKCFSEVVAAYALLYQIHNELDDGASAFADLKAMIKAAYQYRNPKDICLAHANVAEWYDQQHDYKKALHQWELALRAGQELHYNPALMGDICCGMATNLIKQNRLQEAETFVDRAFDYRAQDKRRNVNYARLTLAYLRERQNRLAEAHQLISLVLNHIRHSYSLLTVSALETLHRIQIKQGKYHQALATYQAIKTLNDSLQEVRTVRTIAMLESKFNVEKNKKDIALLKKNAAIAKLDLERTRQQQLTYTSLVVGLTLLIALVGWFSWQTRQKNRTLERQQNEILTQAEHLQELNTLKDKLFMMIGHDLRSPVMNLKNNLNKLTAEPLSPEQLTVQIDRLKRTIDTLYNTLDNLLHWAALQSNGVLTRQQPVILTSLVTETLALLEPAIIHKKLHLIMNTDNIIAWTDEYQAQIVVRNIVHNAIKYTPPEGQIAIRFEQSDREAVIAIADTGVGMTTTDPLRAASVLSRRGTLGETGTGLGLQVCDELMKRNNGRLEIESTAGQGTTVRLVFPIKEI